LREKKGRKEKCATKKDGLQKKYKTYELVWSMFYAYSRFQSCHKIIYRLKFCFMYLER
jgi:hypothetical protein